MVGATPMEASARCVALFEVACSLSADLTLSRRRLLFVGRRRALRLGRMHPELLDAFRDRIDGDPG